MSGKRARALRDEASSRGIENSLKVTTIMGTELRFEDGTHVGNERRVFKRNWKRERRQRQ